MKALLLAAGLGTRLRPITDKIPKCLVPIHGRPLLSYWFDMLFAGGVTRVLVNTHYHAEAVNAFVAESPWRDRVQKFNGLPEGRRQRHLMASMFKIGNDHR